jgi:hypothetical protein
MPVRQLRQHVGIADPDNLGAIDKPSFSRAAAVAPHATNALANTSLGIMVNVAGDIAAKFEQSASDVTLTLLAGVLYPFRLTHIRVTGTTATGIHAFW